MIHPNMIIIFFKYTHMQKYWSLYKLWNKISHFCSIGHFLVSKNSLFKIPSDILRCFFKIPIFRSLLDRSYKSYFDDDFLGVLDDNLWDNAGFSSKNFKNQHPTVNGRIWVWTDEYDRDDSGCIGIIWTKKNIMF